MAFVLLVTNAFLSHFAVAAASSNSSLPALIFGNSTAEYKHCYDGPYGVTGIITIVVLTLKALYCVHFEKPECFNYRRFLPEFVAIVLMASSSVITFAKCTEFWEIAGAFGQLSPPFFLLAAQVLTLSGSAWTFNISSLFFLLTSVMQLILLTSEVPVEYWINTKTSIIMLVAYLAFALVASVVGTAITKEWHSLAAIMHVFLMMVAPILTILQYVGFSYAFRDIWGKGWIYLIGTAVWCILLPNRVKPGEVDADRLYWFYCCFAVCVFCGSCV